MTADDLKLRDFVLVFDLMQSELKNPELSPVEAGRKREAWLAKCLVALATVHGAKLREPLCIDSRGEYSLQAASQRPDALYGESGEFGLAFANVLNAHQPRTGVKPGAILLSNSSWCYMNHFDAERMVSQAEREIRPQWNAIVMQEQLQSAPATPVDTPSPARRPRAV